MNFLYRKNPLFYLFRKAVSAFLVVAFGLSMAVPPSGAQLLANLPAPGQMLWLSSGFLPPVLKGMTVHAENPLLFDFIVDRGQDKINNGLLKDESTKLIKYFLAAMTIPDKDAWVNLSPYEKDRIIPDALGQTEMGRQMLEQDYILKQLSASLTNPDKELGQKFWSEVKTRAQKQFGTAEVPLNTFNKVWIVPDGATVVEKDGFAYITESKLKVMLDVDLPDQKGRSESRAPVRDEDVSKLSTDVFRELILPQLNKELNEGKNFAPTRQVYQSVILAAWYKKALKDSLLGRIYADRSKVEGIESDVKGIKQKVYDQYLDAFKKGVYNVIKEDSADSEAIPRKYFSGGLQLGMTLNSNDLKIVRGSADVNRAASAIVQAGDQIALVSSSAAESKGEQSQLVLNALDSQRAVRINDIYNAVYAKMGKKYLDPFGNPLSTSQEYGTFAPSSLREVLPLFRQFGVGPGKKFVDLGSGDGRVALAAALLGANAIGVEKDPQLVAIAKQAFARVAREINVPWSVGFYREDISQYSLQDSNAPDVIYYYQGGGVDVDEAVRNKIMAGTTNPNAILIVAGFAREYDLFPELTRVTTPEFEDQNWTAVYKVPAASSGVTVNIPDMSPFQFISILEENLGLRINYLGNHQIQVVGISDSSRHQRIHDAAVKMIADGRRGLLQDKIFSDFSAKIPGGRAQAQLEMQKDALQKAIGLVLDAMGVIKPLAAPVTAGGLQLNVSKITEYNEADLQFLAVVVDRVAEKQKQLDQQSGNITGVRVAPLPRSQDGLTYFSVITYGEKQFIVKYRRENTLGREGHLQNQYEIMQKINANGGHPAIVPVIDFGSENGRTYLVTGFAPGKDLAQIVKLPRLNVNLEKIVDFAVKFAEAVKFVHDQGVVIRDLNPYNVRIASDGSVTLFDFDASMQVSYDWEKDPYLLHNLRGTDYYSDGFYLDSDKIPDFQLDIAQIGVDLFYYATGYYPIDEDTNYRDQLPLRRIDQYSGLRNIIERTVAARENGRYKNVDELLTDLKALQSSLKADGTSSASSSVFGDEEYLSRPLSALEKAYGLSSFLDKRKGQEKVTMLLVGVGRGIAAMQLALEYPNLEIVAVNNQEGMWNDNKAAAVASQLNNVAYTPAQIQEARARISVVETLDIENAQARETQLSKFTDQDGKFDMVFFETLVTMYLKDQVQTIEQLFNERVKVGGVYGFEISRVEARPEMVALLSAELSKAFAKSGEVKSVEPAKLVPRFFTVERSKSDDVVIPLKKASSVRHRPRVVSNFDQPVYTTEYELVSAQATRAASSSLTEDDLDAAAGKVVDAAIDPSVLKNDKDQRTAVFFIKMLLNRAFVTDPDSPQAISSIPEFDLQKMWADLGLTIHSVDYPKVLSLYESLGMTSIADTKIKNLKGENPVIVIFPDRLVKQMQQALADLQDTLLLRDNVLRTGRLKLLTDFAEVTGRFYQRTGKRPSNVTNASAFLVGLANRRLLSRKALNDSRRIDQKEFVTLKAIWDAGAREVPATFEEMLSYFDIHEENGRYVIPEELAQDVLVTMEANEAFYTNLSRSIASSGVALNSDGESMVSLLSDRKFRKTKIAQRNLTWLMAPDPLGSKWEERYRSMTYEELGAELPVFVNGRVNVFYQAPFVDNKAELFKDGVAGFLDVLSFKKYALPDFYDDINEIVGDFIGNSLVLGRPGNINYDVLSAEDRENVIKAKAWVREVFMRSGVNPQSVEALFASSGVADGDFIGNELGVVVDRILTKLKVNAGGEVLSAVMEGTEYIALDAWWRGESGWVKETIAADGNSVFVISQPVLNKLLVKHLQRYPKSVDIFRTMGVRDVQGQITLSLEFVKIVNDEVLYSSSGSEGGAVSSSGIINAEGYVVPTRIPFAQIRTIEAFGQEIGDKFYSVNYGEYRGRTITIFWAWEEAGERIKTYILDGDYRDRLPEAVKLFETKSKGRVQSRYAGFDLLTGKEYTIHDYYPAQFVEPLWTWLQEGNTVNDAEAEIIAAYDSQLNIASPGVGGINFDPTLLNLQIKRDGKGVPLPLPQQNLESIDIKGLYPVIIYIQPINAQTLPLLGQLKTTPDVALSKG